MTSPLEIVTTAVLYLWNTWPNKPHPCSRVNKITTFYNVEINVSPWSPPTHPDQMFQLRLKLIIVKMKVNARNNIIRKLANSKWGGGGGARHRHADPAVSPSATHFVEYACAVWTRSTHARKLNTSLHDCCRIISGCLKPTNLDSVHLQAGVTGQE